MTIRIILVFFILFFTTLSFAAFPIKQEIRQHKTLPQNAEEKALSVLHHTIMPGYGGNPHTEDMGVFGILAIIFAVTLLFPLAIVSGAIGTQNGRKFRGLAKAGLLLGILVGTVFAGYLLYLMILG